MTDVMVEKERVNNTRRDPLVDVVRGTAIFLMLWGHCIQYCYPENKDFFLDVTFKIIYSFHMPLLMFVSGYSFCFSAKRYDKREGKLLQYKVLSIVKPIIFGSVFVHLFTTVFFNILHGDNILNYLNGAWLSALADLWFLWSVLGATTVMCLVKKYAKTRCTEIFIIIFGSLFVLWLPNGWLNLWIYPYYIIGYYCGGILLKKNTWANYIGTALFMLMLPFFEKKHYIYTSGIIGSEYSLMEYIQIDSFRWIIGVCGIIAVITVIQWLLHIKSLQNLWHCAEKLGQKTLYVYILSVVFLSSYLPLAIRVMKRFDAVNCIYNIICANAVVYDTIFTLTLAVIYAVVLYFLIIIPEKLKNIK